jgi:hypothetical protein
LFGSEVKVNAAFADSCPLCDIVDPRCGEAAFQKQCQRSVEKTVTRVAASAGRSVFSAGWHIQDDPVLCRAAGDRAAAY